VASPDFVVVGAGMAGLACARSLRGAGRSVVVRERDRIGGRARSIDLGGRPVDVGPAYFTAQVPAFEAVVGEWLEQNLAVPWTDTFHVANPDGLVGTRTGPMRYTAPGGLRSLVQSLGDGVDVTTDHRVVRVDTGVVDGDACRGVALAVPSPEALDLLDERLVDERSAGSVPFDPCLVAVVEYADRRWAELDAVFVNDSAVLTFVVDDGRRRGDGCPLLVAYVSPVLSAAHLSNPERVLGPVLAELEGVLGITDAPAEAQVVAWPYATPRTPDPRPYFLGRHRVGLCGDAWHAPSRLESAYLSGRALGRALAESIA
jgi:renalase